MSLSYETQSDVSSRREGRRYCKEHETRRRYEIYDSMRERNITQFLWRAKKIYTIYSGIVRAYLRSLEPDFR